MTVDQTLREKAIEAVRIRHKDSPGWGCASWSEGQSCCLADEDWWIQVVLDAVDVSALQERIEVLENRDAEQAKAFVLERDMRRDYFRKLQVENQRAEAVETRVTELEARVALAQRIIDALTFQEGSGSMTHFANLLDEWENGPKEVSK